MFVRCNVGHGSSENELSFSVWQEEFGYHDLVL